MHACGMVTKPSPLGDVLDSGFCDLLCRSEGGIGVMW